MPRSIHAHVEDGFSLRVAVTSDQNARLVLVGDLSEVEPEADEGGLLAENRALRNNLWAYAKTWHTARTLSNSAALGLTDPIEQRAALRLTEELRKVAQKRADGYARQAQWIADVADDLSQLEIQRGWCSGCFLQTEHRKSYRPAGQLPVYVCNGCGSPTLPCIAHGCPHMAIRERGAIRLPLFCAEHRHDIPGFEKAQGTIGDLADYEAFLEYKEPNLDQAARFTASALAGAGLMIPFGLVAAPAIGGAIGAMGMFGGLSGAAASAHGLALLGGGSLAAGGLGMAGGTAVVAAAGATVGGALGASITNAYLQEDSSFRIELLRPGTGGVPVIVANGFLSEGQGERWGGWRATIDDRYPDSPVYRVRWGAKELRHFGLLAAGSLSAAGLNALVKAAAAAATRSGARIVGNVVGPALIVADLARNPWHVAKNRADKTGVIVGDLLARTDAPAYVLVGHSLGARVMAVAAETLGTKRNAPRIHAVHLLGPAIGAKGDWEALATAVEHRVYCYHSKHDNVLKLVYPTAQAGQQAAGLRGLTPAVDKIENVDVSPDVKTHFDYQAKVRLR